MGWREDSGQVSVVGGGVSSYLEGLPGRRAHPGGAARGCDGGRGGRYAGSMYDSGVDSSRPPTSVHTPTCVRRPSGVMARLMGASGVTVQSCRDEPQAGGRGGGAPHAASMGSATAIQPPLRRRAARRPPAASSAPASASQSTLPEPASQQPPVAGAARARRDGVRGADGALGLAD
jgi:hypothetical protein